MQTRIQGGCLGGTVRFRYAGPLRRVVACLCSQCRRTSGHYVAATRGQRTRRVLAGDDTQRRFESSPEGFRGFCATCGSNLFWSRAGSDSMSIMAGSLDPPTRLRLAHHIHAAEAGDYHAIDPGLPRYAQWAPPPDSPAVPDEEES